MIKVENGLFRLTTLGTSYWFRVSKFGHLEHVYYGQRLEDQATEAAQEKRTTVIGSCVDYSAQDPHYSLDNLCLEWSGTGRGDYRFSPCEIKMPDGSFCTDFVYTGHQVFPGALEATGLPTSAATKEQAQTVAVYMKDESNGVTLRLIYTVFYSTNVIARRAEIENGNAAPLVLRRFLSMSMDMPNRNFDMITLDGGWIKEAHKHARPLTYGMCVNSSATGSSSNRHNPAFMLAERDAKEDYGRVYGFNLVYSGNHFGCAEISPQDLVRVCVGVSPHCFEWELKQGEKFEAPEVLLTFSAKGFSGMSDNFHRHVNGHIVRGPWQNVERPVLLNNWEAHFFKFSRGKLVRLARRAKKLGVELFVLDDGWFGQRNSDKAGLGDYKVNLKKLPGGLNGLCKRINELGMDFGLWFEPEMVNADSDLYRAHPEYAVATPGKTPCLGRNQLLLDLTRADVRDYIVQNVGEVLDSANIAYVKWDFNRHISDAFSPALSNQGEFFHRYILGLYEVLGRVFGPRPHILFESCASGGGRFDLGMLCYSPQIWTSDDTDPVERLSIQGGLSLFYPQSAMGAHVSAAPHQQTLRDTPLSTRFNVAAFGCLGYELDLKYLTPAEKREITSQIAFYKEHRRVLQYGRLRRFDPIKPNKVHWQAGQGQNCVCGFFQTLSVAAEGGDYLPVAGLDPQERYVCSTRPQSLYIKRFGGLVKHILPVELNPGGFILRTLNRHYALTDCVETYRAKGDLIMSSLRLNNQFTGSNYNTNTRLLGDFGSNLYVIKREDTAQ